MSALNSALATLFRDPNISVPAIYYPKAGAAVTLRVIRPARGSTEFAGFEVGASAPAEQAEVRVADIGQPREGDTLQIGSDRFRVRKVERGRLATWLLDLAREA